VILGVLVDYEKTKRSTKRKRSITIRTTCYKYGCQSCWNKQFGFKIDKIISHSYHGSESSYCLYCILGSSFGGKFQEHY